MKSYRDETLSLEKRIDALISQMTIEEKVSQLTDGAAAVSRLGVDRYNWWNEALHGVARAGTATVFPQAIGLAAMWNEELLLEIARAISHEARAKYNKAKREGKTDRYYGLTFWSPNINIFRDPRWGRGQETYGEDPYLTARLAISYIKGLQEGDGVHMKAAACVKHLAAHSGPEGIRHGFNSVVSVKDLEETYLPAFEACVKEGEVEAVMGAYNALNGVPCCCNEFLLDTVLRKRWGFVGHFVSDCGAMEDISAYHHYAENFTHAAAKSLKSGCDLCCGFVFNMLIDAYLEDLITEDDLDRALRRTLRARFKLGMFDEKTSYDAIDYSVVASEKHKKLCEEATRQSIVLLKNDGLLPMSRDKIKTVAVIGPNGDSKEVLLGNYNGLPTQYSTVYNGFCELLGKENVRFATGCNFFGIDHDELSYNAVSVAEECDAVVVCLGLDASFEGEQGDANNPYCAGDRETIELPPCQLRLLERASKASKRVIAAVFSGGLFNLSPVSEMANAVFQCWYPGELGGKAIAEAIFGQYSPSGKLPLTAYASDNDLMPFDDYSMKNRTYRYFTGTPLYPFGFGLSYTKFKYGDEQFENNGIFTASVTVLNIGEYDAYETIMLYKSEKDAVNQPLRSLCRFKKVFFKRGESKTIRFELSEEDFSHINESGEREYLSPQQFDLFFNYIQ